MASTSSTRITAPGCGACWPKVTLRSLFAALLHRRQDRPATCGRSALADVQSLPLLVFGAIALVRVIVRQLLAWRDVADGLDVDVLLLVDRLAIRRAAMIDEARV